MSDLVLTIKMDLNNQEAQEAIREDELSAYVGKYMRGDVDKLTRILLDGGFKSLTSTGRFFDQNGVPFGKIDLTLTLDPDE